MSLCDCMTETDPLDPEGPERVLMHSLACPLHPEHDEHREARRRHHECVCGYQATSAGDLREHVEVMTR